MIKLLSLSFEGIGRFTKKQTVDFSNRDKLIQIDGKNENTGGSSGSGKTTMFHALDYLLGFNDTPATGLQARSGKASLWVEGVFDIDGTITTIERSKKDGLRIVTEAETTSGNVKLAEERLEQIIGIPRKLFKKMVHKKQKEGGFFLNLTAKESFEFLIKVLGLEDWTSKIEKIEEDLKSKQKRLTDIEIQVKNKNDMLASIMELMLNKASPVAPERDEKFVSEILSKRNMLQLAIDGIKSELDVKLSQVPTPTVELAIGDTTNLQSIKSKAMDLQTVISSTQLEHKNKINQIRVEVQYFKDGISKAEYAERELSTIIQKIQKLKEQQAHIESATCPTCSQSWTGKSALDKVKEISDEIGMFSEKAWESKQISDTKNSLIDKYQTLNKALETESGFNPTSELESQLSLLRTEAAKEEAHLNNLVSSVETKNKLAQSEYNGVIQSIRNHYADRLSKDNAEIQAMDYEIKATRLSLENYKKSIDNFNRETSEIKGKKDAVEKQIAELQSENKDLLKSILIAEESKKAIKAYTLQIFQESLDYIGEQASQIMGGIPNMANSTIYFESSKETKSGSIKDEVNAIINMDGENEINIKTLSGGERTSIDLAVDLALIEMIESKAGKGADFFILDEPFDGLDSLNKTECLDILQNLDTNKKIIIVDHSTELKAMVHDIITVIRQGEDSFVV